MASPISGRCRYARRDVGADRGVSGEQGMSATSRQRVFVTGATGFVGSFLTRQLVEAGRDVAILLRPTSDSWRIADVIDRVHVIDGTMEDVAGFAPRLADFRPDAVAHLAWRGVTNQFRN